MANYKLVGIARGHVVEHQRKRPGAPTEAVMVEWGNRHGCFFVARYYPSLKGWRALRIDKAVKVTFGTRGAVGWRGQQRGRRVYPNEDAVVMHCMALLGTTPDT